MSILQEQAIQMVCSLSDDNVRFLIEIIRRLMPQGSYAVDELPSQSEALQAFHRLNAAQTEIRQYLPENFDPDRELEEARAERYESID